MANLTLLPPPDRDRADVDASLVALLERWLEKAKAGRLSFVGLIGVYRDGVDGCWATSASELPEHEIVGRIEQIKHRFLNG